MRQAITTFVAALLGVLVAQFAFHFYERYEDERAEAALDAELQARVEQGRQLAEQTLAEQRAAQAIREALIAASGAKVSVSEYYMTTGQMPASNAEVGLGEPDSYRGQSLLSMQVADGGRIVLAFDAASGVEGGTIELTPDLAGHESMGVQWLCTTNDFVNVARAWPGSGCEYTGQQGSGAASSQ
ncbi:pilin [Dokdonella sp.]|uniref:pilin n=1 Tax=Dokdonella sp. TaxID=2291710 RepID=UPI003527AF80